MDALAESTITLIVAVIILLLGLVLIVYSLFFSKHPIFYIEGWHCSRWRNSRRYQTSYEAGEVPVVPGQTTGPRYGVTNPTFEPTVTDVSEVDHQIYLTQSKPSLHKSHSNDNTRNSINIQMSLEDLKSFQELQQQKKIREINANGLHVGPSNLLQNPLAPQKITITRENRNNRPVTRTQSHDIDRTSSRPIPILINKNQNQILKSTKTIQRLSQLTDDFDRNSRLERSRTISVCPSAPTMDDLYNKPFAPVRSKRITASSPGSRRRTVTVE